MTYPDGDDLKTYLGIAGSSEDTALTQIIEGVVSFVEKWTNRVFVAAAATREFPVIDYYVKESGRLLWMGGKELVDLTTLTNGDGVEIAASDLFLLPIEGPFDRILLHPTLQFNAGGAYQPISVEADWGYSAACPADLFEAMLEHGAILYRMKTSGGGGQVASGSRQTGVVFEAGKLPDTIISVYLAYRL